VAAIGEMSVRHEKMKRYLTIAGILLVVDWALGAA
jgi:hypothetical protein